MRIAAVGPTYPFRGGISHFNTLLCEYLRSRHDLELFGFRRQYPAWLFPGTSDRDPSDSPLQTAQVALLDPMSPHTWWQTARRICAFNPDLLILNWWVTFWSLPFAVITRMARRQHIPVLYICHNVLPHEQRPVDWLLTWVALRQGDSYIVMADSEKQRLVRLIPDADVRQVSLPSFAALAQVESHPSRFEAHQRLGLEHSGPVALFFGFVRPYKGLHFLLEAMHRIIPEIDLHLLIAGEFWQDKQEYLESIQALEISDRVTIVDRYIPNEEISTYFSAVDVVVLPYIEVTQSAVLQLAYGFGKPVITTAVGDLAEVVEHGKTGLVVPPADPDALSRALYTFFTGRMARDMCQQVLARQGRFSWENLGQAIEEASSAVRLRQQAQE